MKIFIGLTEIAGIAANYAKGFRELGHETYVVLTQKNKYYEDPIYDLILSRSGFNSSAGFAYWWDLFKRKARLANLFPGILDRFDVFVFLWGTSFLPYSLDYFFIKNAGRKMVSTFWGSEIRYGAALYQEMKILGVADEIKPFLDLLRTSSHASTYSKKKRVVDSAERFADLILSQPGYGQLQTRPYMRANVPIDLRLLQFQIPDRKVPLILHIPSNRGVKGTEYILETIRNLHTEGLNFDFRLVENMPNEGVRKLLGDADIVIDELFSETVGVLSAEAMASGTVVLVRYMPEYAAVPSGCPAVNVTKDTLMDKLREVIVDRKLRRQLAEAGRPYVEANNDHVKVASDILHWLEPGGIREYDFTPRFYQSYQPYEGHSQRR